MGALRVRKTFHRAGVHGPSAVHQIIATSEAEAFCFETGQVLGRPIVGRVVDESVERRVVGVSRIEDLIAASRIGLPGEQYGWLRVSTDQHRQESHFIRIGSGICCIGENSCMGTP